MSIEVGGEKDGIREGREKKQIAVIVPSLRTVFVPQSTNLLPVEEESSNGSSLIVWPIDVKASLGGFASPTFHCSRLI